MFSRRSLCVILFLSGAMLAGAQSYQVFKLTDGTTFNARLIAPNDAHAQLALESGGYTNIPWGRFSQETLKELEKNRAAARFASLFIDPPPSNRTTTGQRRIAALKPVPRLDRPSGGSLFASPVMLVVFLIIYAANIYAGYEIALYRRQPAALVCVLAAVIPIIGPGLFLAMPTRQSHVEEEPLESGEVALAVEGSETATETPAATEAHAHAPSAEQPVTYARGQFTFNRRFFETKFAGFLKTVPGDAERDKVIAINSARGEYVGQRLSKLEPNELFLQVRKGDASEEVMIPFSEIYEVQIKSTDT